MNNNEPKLFGLNKTNRDFRTKESWGKNQFNSSFPASLCCYLAHKNIDANYLVIRDGGAAVSTISISDVFGIATDSDDLYFAFEAQHTPFQRYIVGTLPRTDLVIQNITTSQCLSALEVKLTALPDNSTCTLSDDLFGCEIVVRPDTIAYLACGIAASLGDKLNDLIPDIDIQDWSDAQQVLKNITDIINLIKNLVRNLEIVQQPFLLQPVWKTQGKSPNLAEHCLDVFIWSNAGFLHFVSEIANEDTMANGITRQTRTAVWLYKMLMDIKNTGRFNNDEIINNLSYNTKNDKAFSSSGRKTNPYMKCDRLTTPIITKDEIKNIILGGGQNLLSPERRFDAIIFNSTDIF